MMTYDYGYVRLYDYCKIVGFNVSLFWFTVGLICTTDVQNRCYLATDKNVQLNQENKRRGVRMVVRESACVSN